MRTSSLRRARAGTSRARADRTPRSRRAPRCRAGAAAHRESGTSPARRRWRASLPGRRTPSRAARRTCRMSPRAGGARGRSRRWPCRCRTPRCWIGAQRGRICAEHRAVGAGGVRLLREQRPPFRRAPAAGPVRRGFRGCPRAARSLPASSSRRAAQVHDRGEHGGDQDDQAREQHADRHVHSTVRGASARASGRFAAKRLMGGAGSRAS